MKKVVESWVAADAQRSKATGRAMDDMFQGGIANVSRHTRYRRRCWLTWRTSAEKKLSFSPRAISRDTLSDMPVRKKRLIQLGSDYYAVDPCFTRDAGYRALLHNLLRRKPDYKKTFEVRRKTMSEAAFADILAAQLPGATVFQEVLLQGSCKQAVVRKRHPDPDR